MANVIAPFGALDYTHQGGSQRTEELATRWIASSDVTPIFYGDLIVPATPVSTGLATGGFGPYITQGTSLSSTGTQVTAPGWAGVFRGCEFFNPTSQRMQFSRFWPGATVAGTSSNAGDIKAFLVNDSQMRFIIQASSQNILGSSNVGQLYNCAINGSGLTPSSAGGNFSTGNSGMALASSAGIAATSSVTAPFRLVDFYSNYGPGLLPGQVPSAGTGLFVNGMDNTSAGQWVIVQPWYWDNQGP
jgi:hypothetical protein